MIECPKCSHDNDLGRIFCAKCGEKLEISRVRAPSGIRKGKKKAQSWDKMAVQIFSSVVKVVVMAFSVAFITAVWLPPHVMKREFAAKHLVSFKEKRNKVEEAMNTQDKLYVEFNEPEINAGLGELMEKTTDKGLLENIYICPEEDNFLVTIQNKWKWFRLYVQVVVKPENKNGRWIFKTKKVRLGRLELPSQLHGYVMDGFVSRLWAGMSTEKQWLEQMSSVKVITAKVQLTATAVQ